MYPRELLHGYAGGHRKNVTPVTPGGRGTADARDLEATRARPARAGSRHDEPAARPITPGQPMPGSRPIRAISVTACVDLMTEAPRSCGQVHAAMSAFSVTLRREHALLVQVWIPVCRF